MPALLVPPAPSAPLSARAGTGGPLAGGPLADVGVPAPGRVTVFLDAAGSGTTLVPELCAAAAAEGALAIVVDGGNAFSAYTLVEAARRRGLDAAYLLASVRVARAFTAYQFQALVEDALPAEVADAARRGERVGLVAVVGFPELYTDEDVPAREVRVLATRAVAAVRRLAGGAAGGGDGMVGAGSEISAAAARQGLRALRAVRGLRDDDGVSERSVVSEGSESLERSASSVSSVRSVFDAAAQIAAPPIPVLLTAGVGDGRARTMMDRHGWGMPVRVSAPARLPWLRRLAAEGADEVATVRATAHGLRVALPRRGTVSQLPGSCETHRARGHGVEVLLAAGRQRSLLDFDGDHAWDARNLPSASSWTGSSTNGTTTAAGWTPGTPPPSTASSVARGRTRARA